MCHVVAVAAVLDALVTSSLPAAAQPNEATAYTYFVSCHGNDGNEGTSTTAAWASLSKVSTHEFAPGDTVRLERGCVWTGTVAPKSSGSSSSPIVVSAYGSGALPRIVGRDSPAVKLWNVSNWTVEDLDLTQIDQRPQPLDRGNAKGKDLASDSDRVMRAVVDIRALGPRGKPDCASACRVRGITLHDLVVHDGQWDGIYVGAGYLDPADGVFGSVDRISISEVEARGNQAGGIIVEGTFTKVIRYEVTNVAVLDSLVYGNGGDGVMLGQVEHGLIQGNRCAYNGSIRNARNGCWSWDSKDITIQYNEADHNMTPFAHGTDGGGFDLDMGSIDSVIQYNWSHDNQGEGYLLESKPIGYGYQCCISRNDTVRYNISQRDGQKNTGGIEVFGGVQSAWIYNNTVEYVAPRDATSTTGDLVITTDHGLAGLPRVNIYNNVFVSSTSSEHAAPAVGLTSDGKGTFRFDHNIWYRAGGGVEFVWGGARIDSWSGWRALGFDPHGRNAPAKLVGAEGSDASGVGLRQDSPAIGTGANLIHAPMGMGARDYFGTPVPQGGRYDVGAAAFPDPKPTTSTNASPVPHSVISPSSHVAAVEMGCSPAGTGKTSVVPRGGVVHWCIRLTGTSGSPAPGQWVTTTVYRPSWESITATISAVTDSSGTARFALRTHGDDPTGTYFLFVSQVVPTPSTYYDSYQNSGSTGRFTVG